MIVNCVSGNEIRSWRFCLVSESCDCFVTFTPFKGNLLVNWDFSCLFSANKPICSCPIPKIEEGFSSCDFLGKNWFLWPCSVRGLVCKPFPERDIWKQEVLVTLDSPDVTRLNDLRNWLRDFLDKYDSCCIWRGCLEVNELYFSLNVVIGACDFTKFLHLSLLRWDWSLENIFISWICAVFLCSSRPSSGKQLHDTSTKSDSPEWWWWWWGILPLLLKRLEVTSSEWRWS